MSEDTMMKIGFIGLGHMGAPMALNLLKAGHRVHAFDLSADALRALQDAGAQAAASPREAATDATFVITMLPA
ncbi:3-hydroxyisobutyrate dehydrogenase, partial [Burkholderia sp. TJI49]